jgi:hypothetical protein
LTPDKAYLTAVLDAFGSKIDYEFMSKHKVQIKPKGNTAPVIIWVLKRRGSMEAGLTKDVMTIEEIVRLAD